MRSECGTRIRTRDPGSLLKEDWEDEKSLLDYTEGRTRREARERDAEGTEPGRGAA